MRISDWSSDVCSSDLRTGSGTRYNAEIIMAAYGLRFSQLKIFELDPGEAADLMSKDGLDAFFLISGQPAPTVGDLTDRGIAAVIPLSGRPIGTATRSPRFFNPATIAHGHHAKTRKAGREG